MREEWSGIKVSQEQKKARYSHLIVFEMLLMLA